MEQENGASSTEDIQKEVEKVRKSQHLILKWSLNNPAFLFYRKFCNSLDGILYTCISTVYTDFYFSSRIKMK